jgi:hypothetical protein
MLVVDMDGDKPVRWEYVPPPKVEAGAHASPTNSEAMP